MSIKANFLQRSRSKITHLSRMLDDNYREEYRLRRLQRRVATQTNLYTDKLGIQGTVEVVDACTYLEGYDEIFKKEIYRFKSYSKRPKIIDCGANIGLSILYFKSLYPDSKIIGFEPDPFIYKTLCRNIKNTGYDNIILKNEAVWTEDSDIKFTQEGSFSGRISKPRDEEYKFSNSITVRSTSLKKLILSEAKIDFLKLDVEGAETEIILDCSDVLENINFIFIEYHSHQHEKQKLHRILEILENHDFRYSIQEAFVMPQPFMDLGQTTMLGMDLQLNIFAYQTNRLL